MPINLKNYTTEVPASRSIENIERLLMQFGATHIMKEIDNGQVTATHKCKNRPQFEIAHVYVIVLNRLYCRVYFGGYQTKHTIGFTADGREKIIDWPRIILAGPIEKCPFKRTLRGFRGFRYTTKLF